MNVRELKALLSQCDPEALVVAPLLFQGTEEITSVERLNLGGVGFRPSSEEIPVIRLGNVPHMKKQDIDVLGAGCEPENLCSECGVNPEPSYGGWCPDCACGAESGCPLKYGHEDEPCPHDWCPHGGRSPR